MECSSEAAASKSFEQAVLWHLGQLQQKLDNLTDGTRALPVAPPASDQQHMAQLQIENESPSSPRLPPSSPRPSHPSSHSATTTKTKKSNKPRSDASGIHIERAESRLSPASKESLNSERIALINEVYRRAGSTKSGIAIWRFFEDPTSSRMAMAYSRFLPYYIVFVVGLSFLVFIPKGHALYLQPSHMDVLQLCFESLFVVELTSRFCTCPNSWVFWLNPYNLIDAASGVTLVFRVVIGFACDLSGVSKSVILFLNCTVPILRLLKLMRRLEQFQLLISAFKSAAEALPVVLFTLLLIALAFSGLIFYIEEEMAPTYFHALFFTVVTMSTVGYGNQVPETVVGTTVVGILIVLSGLYLAIPIGIVGNAFSQVWAARGRLLVLQRLRSCIVRAGFTLQDLKDLICLFDLDQDGTLDFDEFATMITMMEVGIQKEWIADVFDTFDFDGDAVIEYDEFLKCLFPQAVKMARLTLRFGQGNAARNLLSRLPSRSTSFDSIDEVDDVVIDEIKEPDLLPSIFDL